MKLMKCFGVCFIIEGKEFCLYEEGCRIRVERKNCLWIIKKFRVIEMNGIMWVNFLLLNLLIK